MEDDRPLAAHRCAVCHDALATEPRRCAGCGTLVHEECHDPARGCPTLGCSARTPADLAPPGAKERAARRADRLLAGGILLVIGLLVLGVLHVRRRLFWPETALYDVSIYEPVARRLALYCQSERRLVPEVFGATWVPEEVASDYPWARGGAAPWGAHIELGGGFLHYGYRLDRDEAASTPAEAVWHLGIYHEWEKPDRVFTLRLGRGERLPASELEALAERAARSRDGDAYR